MKVILSVYPISHPLTGIGRYTWELATRLPDVGALDELRYFNLGRWVTDPQALLKPSEGRRSLRTALASSRLGTLLYRRLSPWWLGAKLRRFPDYLYHSPNFFLPPFPGKSVATFHDLSVYRHSEYHLPASVGLLASPSG